MKHLLTFCMLALGLTGHAQESTFTLRGMLRDAKPQHKLVILNLANGTFKVDTLALDSGRFHYEGTCNGRERRTMMLFDPIQQAADRQKSAGKSIVMYGSFDLSFFVEPQADIEITASADTYPLADIKDARNVMNEDYAALRQAYAPQLTELNRLHAATNEARWEGNTLTVERNEARIRTLRSEMDSIQHAWLGAHPASLYAAYLYTTTYMNQATVPELEAQYARFAPAVQQSEYGQQIVEKIRLNQSVVKGSRAPAFTLTDVTTGKPVSLSDYAGRYLLLDFWGSWCGPCRASHPHLRALYEKYGNDGLAIVGVAADRDKKVILQAAAQDQLPWTQLCMYELREGQQPIQKLYNVTAFPTKFLINPQGIIEGIYVGNTDEIDRTLDDIFK